MLRKRGRGDGKQSKQQCVWQIISGHCRHNVCTNIIHDKQFTIALVEDQQQRVEVGVVKSAHLDRSLEKERESTKLLTQEKEQLKVSIL